jgi:hypothetical protein
MTFTLVADWWLAPLAVTIIAFGWSTFKCSSIQPSGGGSFPDMPPLVWLFFHSVAFVVTLIAWLIWAVLT